MTENLGDFLALGGDSAVEKRPRRDLAGSEFLIFGDRAIGANETDLMRFRQMRRR